MQILSWDIFIGKSCFKVSFGGVDLEALHLLSPLVNSFDNHSIAELALRHIIRRSEGFFAEGLAPSRWLAHTPFQIRRVGHAFSRQYSGRAAVLLSQKLLVRREHASVGLLQISVQNFATALDVKLRFAVKFGQLLDCIAVGRNPDSFRVPATWEEHLVDSRRDLLVKN